MESPIPQRYRDLLYRDLLYGARQVLSDRDEGTGSGVTLSRDAFVFLVLLAVTGGLVSVVPVAGLACLAVCTGLLMLLTRRYGDPAFLLGLVLPTYLLTGGLNISLYRGDIDPAFLRFASFSVLALLGGFALALLPGARPKILSATTAPVPDLLVYASALPGAVGLVWMLASAQGLPLLEPALRFAIDPKALVLVETLFVPLILRGVSLWDTPSAPVRKKLELGGWFLLLALPGYRGWLVGALGVLMLVALARGVTRRTLLWAGSAGVLSLVILVSFALLRRLTQAELFDPAESLRMHGAEDLPQWFAQLHFAVRESLFVGQGLWLLRQDGVAGPSLLFADLITLLPGQQQAAGAVLGDFFGRSLAGGLTASLPGVLFYEYGNGALAVLAGLGVLMGLGWRRVRAAPSRLTLGLYALCYFYLLHFFHRGTVKLAYLLVPLMLAGVIFLIRQTRRREALPCRASF